MGKRIALTTIFALAYTFCYAQTRYHSSTKTIDLGNGTTYKCENKFGLVNLYNSTNKFTNDEWGNIDDTPLTVDVMIGDTRTYDITISQHTQLRNAVMDAFTLQQRRQIGHYKLGIQAYIDPLTGRIVEVEFQFLDCSPFVEFSPQIYRRIEMALLSDDIGTFTVTDAGRKLNYLILGWNQTFERDN